MLTTESSCVIDSINLYNFIKYPLKINNVTFCRQDLLVFRTFVVHKLLLSKTYIFSQEYKTFLLKRTTESVVEFLATTFFCGFPLSFEESFKLK